MNRRDFLGWMAASCAAADGGGGGAGPVAPRPNVLMLYSDDQRFDTIAALGNPEIRTPNLDRLAARGCAFTHAHTMGGIHGALCIPSRAMLMTGRTLYRAPDHIPDDLPLWPQVFGQAGYVSFGVGKWHNNREAFARAFQQGGPVFFGGMADHWNTPVHDFDLSGRYPPEQARPAKGHSSEVFTDAAIRFLREYREERPFMAYVAYTAPHDPRTAPPEYAALYDPAKVTLPPSYMQEHPFDNGELHNRDEDLAPFPRTPEDIRRHIADYYAMITHLDAQVGRLLDALAASPHAASTLVVFAGDNGLAVGRHGLLGKQNCYDHSLRVPLIFAGPGVPPGVRRDDLCYLLDIFPTACELAGVAPPATVEGRSLVPAMRGDGSGSRDSLFLAYRDLQRGVRERRWKLIEYRVGDTRRTQLFDMEADPWELRNLSDRPERAADLARLRKKLAEWQKAVGDPAAGKKDWG